MQKENEAVSRFVEYPGQPGIRGGVKTIGLNMGQWGANVRASAADDFIGGVFATEHPQGGAGPHPDACALSTGRACLAAILRALRPARVYVPFYTCNTVFQPFVDLGIPITFYAIDERFAPKDPPVLGTDEYILWTNYFGLCGEVLPELSARYGAHLLIDDTHAFFSGRHARLWSFTSARKFFGVPDGAYLFAPAVLPLDAARFSGASLRHLALRSEGKMIPALQAEAAYERTLDAAVRSISATSEKLLCGCDMAGAARIRRENFAILHAHLAATNRLSPTLADGDAPFCYPYLPARPPSRAALYRHRILVQPLWADVLIRATEGFAWERHLSRTLLALPLDQRYGAADMETLAQAVSAVV